MRNWRFVERYGGIFCLLASGVAAFSVGHAMSLFPVVTLPDPLFTCLQKPPLVEHSALYSTHLTWLSLVTLETVIAGFACLYSTFCIVEAARGKRADKILPFAILWAIGAVYISFDVYQVLQMKDREIHGLLSLLLSTLSQGCDSIRDSVIWGRMLGEPPGIVIGVAMAATVTMAHTPTALELGMRMGRLNHLLYAASALFVAGILVTRANVNLILANWDYVGDTSNLSTASVLASGIAYSCILVLFYLPTRALAAFHAQRAIPETESRTAEMREKWLKEYGLSPGFRSELQHILAILAPLISAPVFDALAK